MLIKPRIIEIKDIDNVEVKFKISRIPAIHFLELLKKYPLDSKIIPQIDNETLFSIFSYVACYDNNSYITLDEDYKINKYIQDTETLLKIETQLILYNIDFLQNRKKVRFKNGGEEAKYKYMNVDAGIASIISNKFATMHELRTIYDYEDFCNLLEITHVNISNEIYAQEKAQKK